MKLTEKKGITLVSLVITIIVLIILAGISLNLTIGENGLFTIAKKAKENTELAQIEEQTRMNELYTQMEQEGYYDTPAIGELQDTIDSLNKNIEELESQLENERQERQELQSQIEGLEAEVNNLKGEVSKANTQIQEKESEIAKLNKQIEQGQADIQANQKQIDVLQSEVNTLKQQVAENKATIQAKEEQIDDMNKRLTTIETSLENKEKQIEDLENKQNTLNTQVENLKTQIQQVQEKNTQLSNKLDEYENNFNSLINCFDYQAYEDRYEKDYTGKENEEITFFTFTETRENSLVSLSALARYSSADTDAMKIRIIDKTSGKGIVTDESRGNSAWWQVADVSVTFKTEKRTYI